MGGARENRDLHGRIHEAADADPEMAFRQVRPAAPLVEPQILACARLGVSKLKTGPMPAENTEEIPEISEEITDKVVEAVPAVLIAPPPPAPPPPPPPAPTEEAAAKPARKPYVPAQAVSFGLPSGDDDIELGEPEEVNAFDDKTDVISPEERIGISFSEILRVVIEPEQFLLNRVSRASLCNWIQIHKKRYADDAHKLSELRRALVIGGMGHLIADGTVDVIIHGHATFNV